VTHSVAACQAATEAVTENSRPAHLMWAAESTVSPKGRHKHCAALLHLCLVDMAAPLNGLILN